MPIVSVADSNFSLPVSSAELDRTASQGAATSLVGTKLGHCGSQSLMGHQVVWAGAWAYRPGKHGAGFSARLCLAVVASLDSYSGAGDTSLASGYFQVMMERDREHKWGSQALGANVPPVHGPSSRRLASPALQKALLYSLLHSCKCQCGSSSPGSA